MALHVSSRRPLPARRPAETGGVAIAVANLVCYLAGVRDPVVFAAVGTIAGAVPAGITWVVEQLRGSGPA